MSRPPFFRMYSACARSTRLIHQAQHRICRMHGALSDRRIEQRGEGSAAALGVAGLEGRTKRVVHEAAAAPLVLLGVAVHQLLLCRAHARTAGQKHSREMHRKG